MLQKGGKRKKVKKGQKGLKFSDFQEFIYRNSIYKKRMKFGGILVLWSFLVLFLQFSPIPYNISHIFSFYICFGSVVTNKPNIFYN